MSKIRKGDYLHKEHPKTCAEDDFWGQISRTVHGKPVSQDDIDMIVRAINDGIAFSPEDVLLDIGCGNGALSQYFFNDCSSYLGVDFSEYLIQVAKKYFERKPTHVFVEMDAIQYVQTEVDPSRFTKALCYGVFSYFSFENAETFLNSLNERFSNIGVLFIGNLPDRERAHLFYPKEKDFSGLLDDRESPLGIWRSKDEFRALASKTGWEADFSNMPKRFFSSHYRYDALLTRPDRGFHS